MLSLLHKWKGWRRRPDEEIPKKSKKNINAEVFLKKLGVEPSLGNHGHMVSILF
jgi:hypothetical protein